MKKNKFFVSNFIPNKTFTMVAKILDTVLNTCCGGGGKNDWKPEKEKPETQQAQPMKKPQNKKKKGKFTDKDMKYETTVWKDLPLKVKKACQELGYDKDKWDNSEPQPIEKKRWKDLTEAELKAVETLGWEQEAWEHQYDHTEFKDLPELQKKAAEALGITDEHKWNHWPHELEHKHWNGLTEEEKQALAVFGFHKTTWD